MKLNKRIKLKLRNAIRRSTSLFLAFLLIFEVSYPTQLLALTGGPSQPEVQSFEPIGTSDMVDVFSGDFNYNLPLMDVEGYPINIAYHGGVGMDQEASWVGLGWNINPGVINRNMRGLPDDFSGDQVQKEINIKPNKTWGVAAELQLELYGYEGTGGNAGNTGSVNLGFSFGFNFNNYTGPSITQGINLSLSCGNAAGGGLNAGLGLNSSSDDGLTIQPSAGFSVRVNQTTNTTTNIGATVGTAFNSRGGLKQLSINVAVTRQVKGSETKAVSTTANGITTTVQEPTGKKGSASMGGQIAGATFDFGTATYNPSITNSMKNYGLSGKFTLGGELWGIHGKIGVSGFFSSQSLAQNNLSNPAYGYLYSENGQDNDQALMDFNREKDGAFNENMACLPLTNYTFDTYAVMGQGIGGSYRPFRSDIGNVSDPSAFTTNDDASLTIELGFGGWVHVGTNISVTDVSGNSGKWKGNNYSLDDLRYSSNSKGSDFENVYFKEANEKTVESDDSFFAAAGGDSPLAPPMDFSDKYEPVLNSIGQIKRKKRDKRTQNMYFVKRSDYDDFAVENINNTFIGQNHHIAEVTTLATDGARYVFGIAAYNTLQREATFSVGSDNPATVSSNLSNNGNEEATKGLIGYAPGVDNTTGNGLGIDNFFTRTTTPPYAHSYLLTSVLSPDYIDADGIRGPSDGDFGSYTKFNYTKINNYKWRTPFEENKGSFTEGLKSDLQDDKANYIYGEKELWYLDNVITKNYIAVFHTSDRQDGVGVKGENGGADASSAKMMKLDSISLYSKPDYNANPLSAIPIKRVHFEYDYSLCKGIPNVTGGVGTTGKLTLKKIYYTYQNSNKARLSPYQFTYGFNPNYNLKGYDRWGNYKENNATSIGVRPSDVGSFVSGPISPSDYPYAEQDCTIANQNAAAWSLEKIQLPSGGTIKVSYESDDYAYVQNRQAMEMFKIVNTGNSDNGNGLKPFGTSGNDLFYFKLEKDHNNNYITDINKYISGISTLYFRFLVKIRHVFAYDNLEYVSGYGEIDPAKCDTDPVTGLGHIGFKSVNLKDNGGGASVNPIIKTSIQYARLYLSKKAYTSGTTSDIAEAAGIENGNGLGLQILDALINSSFTKNIKEAIQGPNDALYRAPYNVGKDFVTNKSWVRLMNPNKKKLGGGARVKQIEMIDEWGVMIGGTTSDNATYGQKYSYTLDDGTSSGVATYEPQLGGDESPFRQPLPYNIEKLMVPDDQFYQEEPMGESFFPGPSIGYSKVTVKNLNYSNVTRHATGKVIHEFYTAKDFPTITKRSDVNAVRAKDDPWSIRSLLKIDVRDYLTAAQGFVVELNDMHGKPKGQTVYQEGQTAKISSVEYKYKQENYLGNFKVSNNCTTIDKNGTIAVKKIGELFDMVADFREDKTTTNNISLGINIDVIPMGPVPGVIPSMWPSFAKQTVRFRSATTTKVIQRFGILEETIATDLGSTVATKNLAFDAETGGVLLTETTTNFNDKVYSFKYPAWWYYDNMGPAYQNIGFEMDATFASGIANVGSAAVYFREGDELAIPANPVNHRVGWVTKVTANTIEVIDKSGAPINVTSTIKVIRSGKRNTMIADMATITTLSNPINSLNSNVYQNVLNAGAVEFSNKRKTYCNCIANAGSPLPPTTNPYILGTKGNWRPLKSFTHLTGRSQSNYNTNTNIRKDGMFTSYTPYYKLVNGAWQMDAKDWTYVSEVTEFTPYGEELENKDALNRYSSATFGYNQSMALSVAANSQYKEQGFDGFEDYSYNPCLDDHFKFKTPALSTTESHTGKYSLIVSGGTTKKLQRQIAEKCEPINPCSLKINSDFNATANLTIVNFSNGTAPLSLSWDIISGNPQITPSAYGGLQINGSGYQIEIKVIDSKGCVSTKTITH